MIKRRLKTTTRTQTQTMGTTTQEAEALAGVALQVGINNAKTTFGSA